MDGFSQALRGVTPTLDPFTGEAREVWTAHQVHLLDERLGRGGEYRSVAGRRLAKDGGPGAVSSKHGRLRIVDGSPSVGRRK